VLGLSFRMSMMAVLCSAHLLPPLWCFWALTAASFTVALSPCIYKCVSLSLNVAMTRNHKRFVHSISNVIVVVV